MGSSRTTWGRRQEDSLASCERHQLARRPRNTGLQLGFQRRVQENTSLCSSDRLHSPRCSIAKCHQPRTGPRSRCINIAPFCLLSTGPFSFSSLGIPEKTTAQLACFEVGFFFFFLAQHLQMGQSAQKITRFQQMSPPVAIRKIMSNIPTFSCSSVVVTR